MNITIAAQAATLAAGRTAYSLAREVLGHRAQVAELQEIIQRQRDLLDRKERHLETAQQQTERAIARGQQLAEQLDEMRDTLAQYEAEEGQEITALQQEADAANDIASDLGTVIDLVRRALGVPAEPHQSLDERLLEAADRHAKVTDLAEKFARARGRHRSQQAMCDLLEAFGLPCARPGQEGARRFEGYQPRAEARQLTSPPAAK